MDWPAIIGVLTGFGLVVVVPVVAIFTTHQRRMAEIMRGHQLPDPVVARQIELLQAQVNDLKVLVQDAVIKGDVARTTLQEPPPPLHERLNG